ncbi:hypothetical protein MUN89_16960 [Halobacillus salinarum]|uniref:Uncharacterized protein n=1 Tax=Halobacillus salinarum TaxID=2932257 RepID=A0ABY4EGI1_9BACI|nr:hypothetical protein [Halobacillus salinarum]UOQ43585.1 hypothetical protein MUN89_16960 [Halobacillus salinarum]
MEGEWGLLTERKLLLGNLGMIITFGVCLLLSLLLRGSGQNAMVIISEVIGALTFITAIIAVIYIKSIQKWVPISVIAFLSVWLVFMIGYEAGIHASTPYQWIWFLVFYLVTVTSIVYLRLGYEKVEGNYKLLPAFFLFFNSMLTVSMIFIHIWWNLPFWGKG